MPRSLLFLSALFLIQCGPPAGVGAVGRCGDRLIGSQEECDDGNSDDADGCTNACQDSRCGDGVLRTDLPMAVQGAELCDDGNDFDGDGCLADCTVASCGDGVLRTDLAEGEPGYETCDDGNSEPWDGCTNSCRLVACGDGEVQGQMGEVCDDGNDVDTDAPPVAAMVAFGATMKPVTTATETNSTLA